MVQKAPNEKLRELDLRPTCADPCVYYSKRGGDPLLVLIYVNILIFYRNEKDLNVIRKDLLQEFEVRDLETVRYCLRIEIARNRDRITLSIRLHSEASFTIPDGRL